MPFSLTVFSTDGGALIREWERIRGSDHLRVEGHLWMEHSPSGKGYEHCVEVINWEPSAPPMRDVGKVFDNSVFAEADIDAT